MRKLTEHEDLVGETVRYVMNGKGGCLVMVFESDCWAIVIVNNGNDDSSAEIEAGWHYLRNDDIKNYLEPDELVDAGLLTPAQRDFLVAENNRKKAEKLRKQAEKLLAQANEIS